MPLTINSRAHIGTLIRLPPNPVIAEIGVFAGEFSQVLSDTYKPSTFYLVDPWVPGEMIASGNQDGNFLQTYPCDYLYDCVMAAEIPNARILRKFSTELTAEDIPDASLDLIYIDGDHCYEGVRRDLGLAMRIVKSGGWITGHDYAMNPFKAHHRYDFGVKRAVDEFCAAQGLTLDFLMNDGCTSFAIHKNP